MTGNEIKFEGPQEGNGDDARSVHARIFPTGRRVPIPRVVISLFLFHVLPIRVYIRLWTTYFYLIHQTNSLRVETRQQLFEIVPSRGVDVWPERIPLAVYFRRAHPS